MNYEIFNSLGDYDLVRTPEYIFAVRDKDMIGCESIAEENIPLVVENNEEAEFSVGYRPEDEGRELGRRVSEILDGKVHIIGDECAWDSKLTEIQEGLEQKRWRITAFQELTEYWSDEEQTHSNDFIFEIYT